MSRPLHLNGGSVPFPDTDEFSIKSRRSQCPFVPEPTASDARKPERARLALTSRRSPVGVRQIGAREAFDLREWVSFAWRHWKFIAAITAIVLVVGTAYLLNQTRLYTATAQVLLDPQKERMPGGDTMLAEIAAQPLR